MDLVGLAIVVIYGIAFSAPLILDRLDRRQRNKEMRKGGVYSLTRLFRSAGHEVALGLAQKDSAQGPELRGRIDGIEVVARCTPSPQGSWATRVSVRPALPLLREIYVQSRWRPPASTLRDTALTGASDIGIGDAPFDALIEAGGRAPVARALLTASARDALIVLARRGVVRIHEGWLAYELLERLLFVDALVSLIREVLAAATAFPRVSDVFAALTDAAHGDPIPGVRARCLATLVAEDPDRPETAAALDTALADPSDAVRVAAARALGERGVVVLREIATRPDSEEEPAARAITLLARRLSSSETIAILDSALSAARHTVAVSAMESLGRAGDAAACERLQALLQDDDETLAMAAAAALGFTHSPAAEDSLVQTLLASSLDLRRAAVRALGRIGHLASIAHLHALIASGECDASLVPIVQQAIAAIQARIPGASPGQVSLAEGEAGQLALADESDSGRLSIVDKQAGT